MQPAHERSDLSMMNDVKSAHGGATIADAVAGAFDDAELRYEGREKTTGRTQFSADVQRPGMLHAAFAFSTRPPRPDR